MGLSCRHWNGDQMCVIDTETTGLDPVVNEIFQICVLPLDSTYKPRRDVLPFNILIKPNYPENWDKEACKIHKAKLDKLARHGIDSELAKDLFLEWVEKLNLPYNKYRSARRRIIPLGHNYTFDRSFIQAWLGQDTYDEIFDHNFRDTYVISNFMNDRYDSMCERVPFSKLKLEYVAAQFCIENTGYHDALQDCLVTAQIYEKMQHEFFPNSRGVSRFTTEQPVVEKPKGEQELPSGGIITGKVPKLL